MSSEAAIEPQGRLLCAWQLAILRFAVTRDDGDRMHVLALAAELDRLGGASDDAFHYFRRTTSELCHAIPARDEHAETVIGCFQTQIDNPRLRRAFDAAIARDGTPPEIVASRLKPNNDLWKGLIPRRAAGR